MPVTVENHGDTAAEEVHVRVTLRGDTASREEAELVLAFVPRHSKREGWVAFRKDPASAGVEARTVGYATP